jgi:ATP-dependent protease HslVU (ClpYQ) peptidase subunit
MSIIVAVRKAGSTVLAADTMHSYGSRREHPDNLVSHPKVYKLGNSYIGGVGWSVYGNIMEHYFKTLKRPPTFRDETSIFDFFLKLWRLMRKRYQVVNDQPDTDDRSPFANLDSEFVVVNTQGVFRVDSDLSVMRFAKYFAVGSGDKYAYGALHALYERRLTAERIAVQAAEAAVYYDQGCGGQIECFRVG